MKSSGQLEYEIVDSYRNVEESMCKLTIITVPTDGLAPLDDESLLLTFQ